MRPTEEQIRELANNLRPVRPIPPLSAVFATGTAIWIASVVVWHWFGSAHIRPWGRPDLSSPTFLFTLIGLTLLAVGATAGAIASSVPGRHSTARAGLGLAALGLAVSVAGGVLSTPWAELRFDVDELLACLSCISNSTGLGILSALISCAFIGYAVVRRPIASASLAIVGGVALGAIVVHATCEVTEGAHQLVSHVLAPLIAAVVLSLPASIATRVISRHVRRD